MEQRGGEWRYGGEREDMVEMWNLSGDNGE
jgi:hypothetical protein